MAMGPWSFRSGRTCRCSRKQSGQPPRRASPSIPGAAALCSTSACRRPGRGWPLGTLGLARVIDYPARDMTITVQAGIRLAVCKSCCGPRINGFRSTSPSPTPPPSAAPSPPMSVARAAMATGRCATMSSASASSMTRARRPRPAAVWSRTSPATTCASSTSARSARWASSPRSPSSYGRCRRSRPW